MGQIANQMAVEGIYKVKDKIDKSKNGKLILVIVLAVISSVFTALLFTVDRQAIGPNGSVVGLATINAAVRDKVGLNLTWDKISDVAMILAVVTALSFAVIGLIQLIKRKSIKKVDKLILILATVYVIIACVYIVFDMLVVVNYRPFLLPDETELEASFPSSHVLVIFTIMSTAITAWDKLFSEKRVFINILRLVSILVMAVAVASRVLSGVHWFTDIAGALLYSCVIISLFDFAIDKFKA